MPKRPHVLLVAGDPSADRHGAALADALRQKRPEIRISALGGPHLQKKADRFLYPLAAVGGFGFWEPILKLPQLWAAWNAYTHALKQERPDLVVPMDYYGFNIRVASRAAREGVPVAYYISPQVWASRPGRIKKLAACVTKMLVLFPFEEKLYQAAGIPVRFVGHPLTERLPGPGEEAAVPTMGLMPGSRRATARRHLPTLIETAQRLKKTIPDLRCILFRPDEVEEGFYRPFLAGAGWIELTSDPDYAERRPLWLVIGVSGTTALENMLLGIPMIIMYRLSALTFWIAKRLIRVPYVGLPNLLANESVVPELLQDQATPTRISAAAAAILGSALKRKAMREALLALRGTLQTGGSSRAAEEIVSLL